MSLEICITTNPLTREFIPCPVGHTLDEQSIPAALRLPAGTPYITKSADDNGNDSGALHFLEMLKQLPAADRRNIAQLNKDFGTEVVDALAEFYQLQLKPALLSVNNFVKTPASKILLQETPAAAGAMLTAFDERLKGLAGKIAGYQAALEQYRSAYLKKAPAAERKMLAKRVGQAHANVNVLFQGELKQIMAMNAVKSSSRGTVWSNPERAMGLARGSKTAAAITLQSSHNFKRIQQFQRVANIAGKGLVVFDAGLRVNKVQDTYNQGSDWQKELAREMAGFGAGVATGASLGGTVTTVLTLMLIATPFGWAIAIGAGFIIGLLSGKIAEGGAKSFFDVLWHQSSNIRLN